MKSNLELRLINSLSGEKEIFKPLIEKRVGMYVCGPTVYSDVHLGNCRTFVNFDLIYRYLQHLGYKVRYVRNITDVGHLEGDADTNEAEDKISKKARLEQIEPMEVAQQYTVGFHEMMRIFNVLPPSIEPRATGHIPEQIDMVKQILKNGFAYRKGGSVYFDVPKFIAQKNNYGQLSGRNIEDLQSGTRDNLKKRSEKRHPSDFAIWMKAAPEHLLRWKSPWGKGFGFPGWHLECSAMSQKYLGTEFDIHGGGYDLKFPHHENEIAQNVGSCNHAGARYWLHANMLLLNGRKMSKSDGNTISPVQLFTGQSEHITKAYTPMAIRFFMLQAHYRSTLDITDEGLQAAEKGYKRLMETRKILQSLIGKSLTTTDLDKEIADLMSAAYDDMSDDFNVPKALGRLFELSSKINALKGGQLDLAQITEGVLLELKAMFDDFIFTIFGLQDETATSGNGASALEGVMNLVIDLRAQARTNKDWGTSDKIRDGLKTAGIQLKDAKEGTTWTKD